MPERLKGTEGSGQFVFFLPVGNEAYRLFMSQAHLRPNSPPNKLGVPLALPGRQQKFDSSGSLGLPSIVLPCAGSAIAARANLPG